MKRTRKRTGRRTTSDAIEILNHLFVGDSPRRRAQADRAYEDAVIGQQVYDLRTAAGLTQKQLAKLVGTDQSVISRLEDADYRGHSLSMLRRIARALGRRVEVRFVKPKAA